MELATKETDREGLVKQARIDLAAAMRIADMNRFNEGIDNHFTLTAPGEPSRYLLIPFGLHWSEVRASDLLEVGLDGQVLSGAGFADQTATCIHGALHARGHVCVLHTHMPYTTALTQLEDMTVEMTSQNAIGFYGRIAYDYNYKGLALAAEEGVRIADALGDKSVLMMANHGVIVSGASVAEAFHSLYFLERTCQTQILSMSTNKPRSFVPNDVIEQTAAQYREVDSLGGRSIASYHFEALKRILDKRDSDYTS